MWKDWKPLTLQDHTGFQFPFQYWSWMDLLISWCDSLVLITLIPTPDKSLSGSFALYVQLSVDVVRANNIMTIKMNFPMKLISYVPNID